MLVKDKKQENQAFFNHIQSEAAMEPDIPDDDPEVDLVGIDLGAVPDKDDLQNLFQATLAADDHPADQEQPGEATTSPQNLHHALWCLGPEATEIQVFDSLWRLLMYLRYWKGGADLQWISNPRQCRRSSSKLNWYQFLDC